MAKLSSYTAKTTPVNADTFPLTDSAASNATKNVSWSNIKATLKAYFDTLYANIAGSISQAFAASTIELGHATDTTISRVSAGVAAIEGSNILTAATGQPLDADLTTIAGLTATTDSFLQAKSSAWAARTIAQVKTDLGLTGTNSGDQTSIVGISGTKAQFDTACSDGNFLYTGDAYVPGGTDVPVTDGGTGASTAAAARTNLSAAINDAELGHHLAIRQALGSVALAETMPLERVTGTSPLYDAQLQFQAVWLPRAATLTGVKWWQTTQGNYTADNNNRVGLYTYSGGTLTLVASSTNGTGDLWKLGSTFTSKAFSSTYAAAAGLYFIGFLYNNSAQTTQPVIAASPSITATIGSAGDLTNSAKVLGYVASQNDLPSTQAMSGVTSYGIAAWFALY